MSGEANQVKWRGVQPVSGIRGIWPAIDSVRVQASEWKAGLGYQLIYTVPAGKRLFVSTAGMASLCSGTGAFSCRLQVRDVADALKYYMFYHYYGIPGQFTSFINFAPAVEAEAGWDVVVYCNNAVISARGLIFGWLEDA
ncbi:MAG: hypothetical protein KAV87_63085 [Desulfobacteraceae bacterium]|nr:hypothetical protein [Desulfobacteraceae bacterium]